MDKQPMKCVVYGLSNCAYCKASKKYLTKYGIPYEEVFVDLLEGDERADVVNYIKELTGGTMFPVIVSDDDFAVGFDKKKLSQMYGFVDETRKRLGL